jgi:mRNA interferase MazF
MTKKPTKIYSPFQIVIVPFPFTDSQKSKRRPAVVLSKHKKFTESVGQTVLAMITSRKNKSWPLDVTIADLDKTGLTAPSIIRMKIFSIDNSFIIRSIGILSKKDQKKLQTSLNDLLP